MEIFEGQTIESLDLTSLGPIIGSTDSLATTKYLKRTNLSMRELLTEILERSLSENQSLDL